MTRAPDNGVAELRALLALNPSLAEDRLHLTHPARLYEYQPWHGSPVVPFPSARQRGAMETIAMRIASGKARGGIVSPLLKRAAELHNARVPRDLAIEDLRGMYAEISALVRVLTSDEGGTRHA